MSPKLCVHECQDKHRYRDRNRNRHRTHRCRPICLLLMKNKLGLSRILLPASADIAYPSEMHTCKHVSCLEKKDMYICTRGLALSMCAPVRSSVDQQQLPVPPVFMQSTPALQPYSHAQPVGPRCLWQNCTFVFPLLLMLTSRVASSTTTMMRNQASCHASSTPPGYSAACPFLIIDRQGHAGIDHISHQRGLLPFFSTLHSSLRPPFPI